MAAGGTFGWPVVDVRVTCLDGKYHPVDSSEMSFKMAGALAFRTALAQAAPMLLEPICLLEVTVPDAYQGDVMGDLNSRRGRVQGSSSTGAGTSTVSALVPVAELARYAVDLRSMTGGRGRFVTRDVGYEPAPAHLADKLRRHTET
jgi:elongation factor G